MVELATDIEVATARGAGVGRFLVEALLDALQSDQLLVAIRESPRLPPEGIGGVDFVFARDDSERQEVIRVGLDGAGRVVSTQLIRGRGKERSDTGDVAQSLLAALRSGESIASLRWGPAVVVGSGARARRALTITVRSDRQLHLALGS